MKIKYIVIALSLAFAFQGTALAQISTTNTASISSSVTNTANISGEIKSVKSNPSEVTLFLSGAQILRKVNVQIPAGESVLKFENLSPYINENSIQVRANKGLTVLSVNHEHNFLAKTENNQEFENLKKKLEQVKNEIILENAYLGVIKEDIIFLQANREIGGKNSALTVAALEQASEFYSKSITALKLKEIKRVQTITALTAQKETLDKQINEWLQNDNLPTGEIIVRTDAPTAASYNLELTYVVNNAGWYPSYDIRAQSITEPLKVAYKANVTQNTRENWNNVKLRFSSANPNLSGNAPKLNPYYLRYPNPIAFRGGVEKNLQISLSRKQDTNDSMQEEVGYSAAPTVFLENATTVEFEIGIPYTIKSDGKNYIVDMSILELPTGYQYYSAPKLEKEAFLIAKVTEWEKYNLLDGEANIFFEGTFVGKTFLDMSSAKDTLEVSLGRDKSITVTRDKIKEYTTKQFIGSKKEEEISWKITVKNNKNLEIKMLLVDQVPLSTLEEIEVSVKNISGGKHNSETGQIKWEFALKPSETK